MLVLPQDNKNDKYDSTCVDDLYLPLQRRLPHQFFHEDEEYEVNGFVILE